MGAPKKFQPVVAGFYIPPTAKVIQRLDLSLKSHLKDTCVYTNRNQHEHETVFFIANRLHANR